MRITCENVSKASQLSSHVLAVGVVVTAAPCLQEDALGTWVVVVVVNTGNYMYNIS